MINFHIQNFENFHLLQLHMTKTLEAKGKVMSPLSSCQNYGYQMYRSMLMHPYNLIYCLILLSKYK